MTVAELIAALNEMPQGTVVYLDAGAGLKEVAGAEYVQTCRAGRGPVLVCQVRGCRHTPGQGVLLSS